MSVGAEIPQHLIGPAERRFAIDHPAHAVKLTDQATEQPWLGEFAQPSVEDELARDASLPYRLEELAAKDFAENAFGEEEPGVPWALPLRVILR